MRTTTSHFNNHVTQTIDDICLLAREKKTKALKTLLDSGICVNMIDGQNSAISLLASGRDTAAVWFLINKFGGCKHKAVFGAAKGGQWELMHALLAEGASKNYAVSGAAYNGNEAEMNQLLNEGASVDSAACGAGTAGHFALMYQLVNEKEANKDQAAYGVAKNHGNSDFHLITKVINTLIEKGANVNYAVSGAVEGGQGALTSFLLDKKASKDWAVESAAYIGDENQVTRLLEDGARINVAVHGAARGGHEGLMNKLLARGASKGKAGHGAARRSHFALINRLVKAGADQEKIVQGLTQGERRLTEQNALWSLSFIENVNLRKRLIEGVENKSGYFNAKAILKTAAACYALMQKRSIGFDVALEIIKSEQQNAKYHCAEIIEMICALAKNQNAAGLKELLDSGVCVNMQNNAYSALSLLASQGEEAAVWFLINRFGGDKYRAVLGAAEGGHYNLMNALLLADDMGRYQAIRGVAYRGDKAQVKRLLKEAPDNDAKEMGLHIMLGAGLGGQIELIQELLAEGEDQPWCIDKKENQNWLAFGAAKRGDKDRVDSLLRDGADFDYAIEGAVNGGHKELMKELLQQDANNENGVVYQAACIGDRETVDDFIESGASKDCAVRGAAEGGHEELMNALLAKDASKNEAAYAAAQGRNFVLINKLVKVGADKKEIVRGAKKRLTEKNILYFVSFIEDTDLRKKLIEGVENKSADFNARAILKDAEDCYALMQKRSIGFDAALKIIENEKKKSFFGGTRRVLPITILDQTEELMVLNMLIQNENAEGLKILFMRDTKKYPMGEMPIALLAQAGKIQQQEITFFMGELSFFFCKGSNILNQMTFGLAHGGHEEAMNFVLVEIGKQFPGALLKATTLAICGAAKGGHESIVYALLKKPSLEAEQTKLKSFAAEGAASSGNTEWTDKLIKEGADRNDALYGAAYGGQGELMNQLLKSGAKQKYVIDGARKSGYLVEEKILSFISLIEDVKLREVLIDQLPIRSDDIEVATLLEKARRYHHYLTYTELDFRQINLLLMQSKIKELKDQANYPLAVLPMREVFQALLDAIKKHSFVVSAGSRVLGDSQVVTDTAYDIVHLVERVLWSTPQNIVEMNKTLKAVAGILAEATKPNTMASLSVFFGGGFSLPGQRDPSTVTLYAALYDIVKLYQTQYQEKRDVVTFRDPNQKKKENRVTSMENSGL